MDLALAILLRCRAVPSLEGAMERAWFRETEQVPHLTHGERRVGQQPAGRIAPHVVDDLLIRHALACEATLERTRRDRELACHCIDVRHTAREAGHDHTADGFDDALT